MDALRKKYKRGEIDQITYRKKVTELTILHLESMNYKYIGKIADGTRGVVVELKAPKSALRVAVKIVSAEFDTDGEINIWPDLVNEHILPLIKWQNITETNASAFFSQKHPATLQEKLRQESFLSKPNGFENAVTCIKDITHGIHYLHQKGLCHMNLEPDHIFLKGNNRARIGGFGYLTFKETIEVKYGVSAVFRPPEAYDKRNNKIDGQKFDIWSLGILAAETLTGQYLTKEISKWNVEPSNWYFELYGIIFDMLQKEKFMELTKRTFKNSMDIDSKINHVINFIKSCLIFSSENRPSAEDLLKHQLFEGQIEKYYPTDHDDIWATKVNPIDLLMLSVPCKNQSFIENLDESLKLNEDKDEIGENLNVTNSETEDTRKLTKTSDESERKKSDSESSLENFNPLDNLECNFEETVKKKEKDEVAIYPSVMHLAKDSTIEKNDPVDNETDSVILHETNYEKCKPQINMNIAERHCDEIMGNDNDVILNNLPKDFCETNSDDKLNLQKNETGENTCSSDLFNDDKMKINEADFKEIVTITTNVSVSDVEKNIENHESEFEMKDDDRSIELTKHEEKDDNEISKINVLDVENKTNIHRDSMKDEESSFKQSTSSAFDSSASSQKHSQHRIKRRRKKIDLTHRPENHDLINRNIIEKNKLKKNRIENLEVSSSCSSYRAKPQLDVLFGDSQYSIRELPLSRKTVNKKKNNYKSDSEKFLSDKSLKQPPKRTDFHRSITENFNRSSPISSVLTAKDDVDYELEPGEIPLWRKDYETLLDQSLRDYSNTSLTIISEDFNQNDEDLEEGEIKPNSPAKCPSKKRFSKIRSWWKRQKQAFKNFFKLSSRSE